MTQELLPPPAPTEANGTAVRRARATAVVVAQASSSDEAPAQATVARAVKWPLRKLLKGIYLLVVAVRGHRVTAAVLALIVVGLLGSGVIVYRDTHPAAGPSPATAGLPGTSGISNAPFTIYLQSSLPPLPESVRAWLHGHVTFNAQEVWNAYSAQEQQTLTQQRGITESKLQSNFDTSRSQGFTITQLVYSGGYLSPDGTSHFTVEIYYRQGTLAGESTYYFLVDSAGKIAAYLDLTPQSSQG